MTQHHELGELTPTSPTDNPDAAEEYLEARRHHLAVAHPNGQACRCVLTHAETHDQTVTTITEDVDGIPAYVTENNLIHGAFIWTAPTPDTEDTPQ